MAKPVKAEVEEAAKEPVSAIFKLATIVDDPLAVKPPAESKLNSVVEAIFCTAKTVPSVVVADRRVKSVGAEALVVALMVTTDRASYVVEPTDRLSVAVDNLMNLPSSVKPPPEASAQAGKPLVTVKTWPAEPIANLLREAAAVPYNKSPVR